ncbi:MAG: DinB family protein [Pseudomonadota bacterium]
MLPDSFAYKNWADARTIAAVAEIDRVLHQQPYAFALQQLNHILIVEDLFRSRLEKKPAPHGATNSDVVPEYDELKRRLTESGVWYSQFVSTLEPSSRQSPVAFHFADGKPGTMSIEEILFHIVNHGSYHRGSIAHALDLAGVDHPADGYAIFIHQRDPDRRHI